MPLPFYQVDAFAGRAFEGNPACVVRLVDGFLPDRTLQAIAAENNVSETAFIVPLSGARHRLRWFTPTREVPLCGHATLAAAHVLFHELGNPAGTLEFETSSAGTLRVSRAPDGLLMDLPSAPVRQVAVTDALADALGRKPREAWLGTYTAAVFETPEQVEALRPDGAALASLGAEAAYGPGHVGCLAPGGPDGADVTSRFFAPGSGIAEDPATGSWYAMLAPLMAARGQDGPLRSFQAFPGRGAQAAFRLAGDRVEISGRAVTVIAGNLRL